MSARTIHHALAALGILAVVLAGTAPVRAQVCTTSTTTLSESFSTTTYKQASTTAGWDGTTAVLSLPYRSNTIAASDETLGFRAFAVTSAGDPDGDGDDDLVVLMMSPNDTDGAGHLHYATNLGFSAGSHVGWDFDGSGTAGGDYTSAGFAARKITGSDDRTSAILISADADGDGDTDLLYLRNDDPPNLGTLSKATLFERTGISGVVPTWSSFDVTTDLQATPDSWPFSSPTFAWHRPAAAAAQFVRYHGNTRYDLAFFSTQGNATSQYSEVFVFDAGLPTVPGTISLGTGTYGTNSPCGGTHDPRPLIGTAGLTTPIAGNVTATSGCVADAGNNSYGGTVMLIEDFDGDGDFDIVTGSISETNLTYHRSNGGTGCPTDSDNNPRVDGTETITFSEGGAAYGVVGDFNGDNRPDFIVGRDAESCGTGDGTAWLFVNQGSDNPRFIKQSTAVINRGADLDWMATLDVDGNGTLDVMGGTAVLDSPYDLLLATSTDLFVPEAEATSKVLDSLDNDLYGIVKVTISAIDPAPGDQPAGTRARIFVSNNGGDDWAEIAGTSAYSFLTYGSDFAFRVVLEAVPPTDLGPEEAQFYPVASVSPTLNSISFDIEYVGKREYSRSGVTEGTGAHAGILYQPSFEFPGFVARMSAFDVSSGLNLSGLERFDDSLTAAWEVGNVSTGSPGAGSRVLYGAYAAGGTGQPDDRLTITSGEVDTPTTTPTLLSLLGMGDGDDAKSAIAFIRNGMADTDTSRPKLYDWGHSNPVYVAEPIGDAGFFDPTGSLDYAGYVSGQAARAPRIYIGGNSGFLHSFDAVTGAEAWGLAPQNLLAKLPRQRRSLEGSIIYRHDEYVDGAVRTFDVYDDGATAWKTILVVGQAYGEGADGNNYYFAVDVTDPADPLPLWQFTDPLVVGGGACDRSDGSDCAPSCSTSCGVYTCDDATCVPTEDDSLVVPSASEEIVIEAEGYNQTASIDGSHNWVVESDDGNYPGYEGDGYLVATPNDGTNCQYDGGISTCGAVVRYHFRVDAAGTYTPQFRGWGPDDNNDSIGWLIDGGTVEWRHADDSDTWAWTTASAGVTLDAGVHTLTVYMREDGWRLDRIVLTTGSAPTGSGPAATCEDVCSRPVCTVTCSNNCVNPETDAWPSCASGQKCCENGDADFCHPLADSCGDADQVLGQTFSPPVVGRVRIAGADRWLAFFGSGYNNHGDVVNVGRSIYAVDVFDGTLVGRWDLDDLPISSSNPSTLANTLPGGIRLVDIDDEGAAGFGYVDRLYIGDLEGRLWRIDTSSDASLSGGLIVPGTGDDYSWRGCVVFDAGAIDSNGNRRWAPIITTPAAAVLRFNRPNLFFGTGGDDDVDENQMYQFFSVRDAADPNACDATKIQSDLSILPPNLEWVIGDGKKNNAALDDLDDPDDEGEEGERYWSDPVTLGDLLVIFVSLPGSIEAVNPCEILDGQSRLFGIALDDLIVGDLKVPAGQSIFGSAPWLLSVSKSRTPAIFLGFKDQPVTTVNAPRPPPNQPVQAVLGGLSASDRAPLEGVTIGDGDDNDGVREATNPLKVIRWREVPL